MSDVFWRICTVLLLGCVCAEWLQYVIMGIGFFAIQRQFVGSPFASPKNASNTTSTFMS
jgi:hypothetical protein